MRVTKQKLAIEYVLKEANRPLTVEEIVVSAQKRVETINIATVYRNLKQLIDTGRVTKIVSSIAGTLYEMETEEHHHHFYCRKCHKSFDLAGCPVKLDVLPEGFRAESHELFFSGLCPKCSQKL